MADEVFPESVITRKSDDAKVSHLVEDIRCAKFIEFITMINEMNMDAEPGTWDFLMEVQAQILGKAPDESDHRPPFAVSARHPKLAPRLVLLALNGVCFTPLIQSTMDRDLATKWQLTSKKDELGARCLLVLSDICDPEDPELWWILAELKLRQRVARLFPNAPASAFDNCGEFDWPEYNLRAIETKQATEQRARGEDQATEAKSVASRALIISYYPQPGSQQGFEATVTPGLVLEEPTQPETTEQHDSAVEGESTAQPETTAQHDSAAEGESTAQAKPTKAKKKKNKRGKRGKKGKETAAADQAEIGAATASTSNAEKKECSDDGLSVEQWDDGQLAVPTTASQSKAADPAEGLSTHDIQADINTRVAVAQVGPSHCPEEAETKTSTAASPAASSDKTKEATEETGVEKQQSKSDETPSSMGKNPSGMEEEWTIVEQSPTDTDWWWSMIQDELSVAEEELDEWAAGISELQEPGPLFAEESHETWIATSEHYAPASPESPSLQIPVVRLPVALPAALPLVEDGMLNASSEDSAASVKSSSLSIAASSSGEADGPTYEEGDTTGSSFMDLGHPDDSSHPITVYADAATQTSTSRSSSGSQTLTVVGPPEITTPEAYSDWYDNYMKDMYPQGVGHLYHGGKGRSNSSPPSYMDGC